jgi:hypothetical protein
LRELKIVISKKVELGGERGSEVEGFEEFLRGDLGFLDSPLRVFFF